MLPNHANLPRWIRSAPAMLCLTLCACQDVTSVSEGRREDPWGRQPDPMLAPVEEAHAPTVKELIRQGYLVVDQRESADYGPPCNGDCFDALYLGKEGGPSNKQPLAEFACPGTDENSDLWKCRILRPPYVPNAGFKPESR